MRLIREGRPEDPALDLAISHALLRRVAASGLPPVARVFRPGPTMALGRLDRLRPGYGAARDAALRHGFTPVLRLGGGHAAGYDAGAVLVELITPQPVVAEGIEERFRDGTALIVEALARAGLDTTVGELPGEYCPGSWSVHAGHGVKVAGSAQRSIRGASLFTAVVVVEGGARLRGALTDVYAALELPWDPRTAGAAEDVVASLRADAVERALVAGLGDRWPLAEAVVDAETLVLARQLAGEHR